MNEFLTATVFVVLAEMGDKTQLLAMAFASQYKWTTVMWGVLIATLFNHFLAVLAGSYLSKFVPMSYVQILAAYSFILFGLWTIRGDELDESGKPSRFNPFWTVAIAFFIAEMGDKTQLATIALAAKYNSIFFVWMGTTTGMMIADAIGIVIGIVLGRSIPERAIKWFASTVFVLFGFYGLYEYLPKSSWKITQLGITIVLTLTAGYLIARAAKPAKTDSPE